MADLASVLEKIRKLRALATSTNVHEASAAAAMADRLMQEYRIEEAQLTATDDVETFVSDPDPLVSWDKNITNWQSWLAGGLSKHYGCASVLTHRNGKRVMLTYGRMSDIATVKYMYAWLSTEIVRLVNLNGRGQGKAWRDSYCKGAVTGILEAMKAEEQSARQVATSTALARIDSRMQHAKAARAKEFPHLTARVSTGASTGDAYHRGRSDGSQIKNTNKLGPSATKLLK